MRDDQSDNNLATSILEFIVEYIDSNRFPPTVREIAMGCDIPSTSTVAAYLNELEDMGMIARSRYKARGIQVLR